MLDENDIRIRIESQGFICKDYDVNLDKTGSVFSNSLPCFAVL